MRMRISARRAACTSLADTGVWSGKSFGWIALGLLGVLAAILALIFGL